MQLENVEKPKKFFPILSRKPEVDRGFYFFLTFPTISRIMFSLLEITTNPRVDSLSLVIDKKNSHILSRNCHFSNYNINILFTGLVMLLEQLKVGRGQA